MRKGVVIGPIMVALVCLGVFLAARWLGKLFGYYANYLAEIEFVPSVRVAASGR
jgi:hypothetical protein